MAKNTVEEQLQVLIPKNLDDIIRVHRDRLSLRISTEEDLQPLASRIPPSPAAVPITRWNFITLDADTVPARRQVVYLFGWNDHQNQTWNTSQVRRFDAAAGLVVTRSGNTYRTAGPRGTETDLDLLHICVFLRETGVGDYFGIPPFFY
jgi:hypothetical protein